MEWHLPDVVNFSFWIQQRPVLGLALRRRGSQYSAALSAWRCATMSACALARSVGSVINAHRQ